MDVVGVVEKLGAKALSNGKDAGKLSFSLKLVGDERWFGCYTSDPKVSQGQQVSFQASQNAGGYWNADVKTIKRSEGTPNVASNPNSSVVPMGINPVARRNDQSVQQAIRRQASRNSAIAALELAIKAGVKLPLPAKAPEQLDALLSLVDEITVRYEKDTEEAMEPAGE